MNPNLPEARYARSLVQEMDFKPDADVLAYVNHTLEAHPAMLNHSSSRQHFSTNSGMTARPSRRPKMLRHWIQWMPTFT